MSALIYEDIKTEFYLDSSAKQHPIGEHNIKNEIVEYLF